MHLNSIAESLMSYYSLYSHDILSNCFGKILSVWCFETFLKHSLTLYYTR